MPLKLTKANQEQLLEAAAQFTESEGWHKDAVAFAAFRDGAEHGSAIAVFQNFRGGMADIHYATGAGHMTRDVIDAYKKLAFHPKGFGLKKLWAFIAADNSLAQRTALGAGFEFEHRLRGGAAGGEDAIVFTMTPETSGIAAAIGPNTQATPEPVGV